MDTVLRTIAQVNLIVIQMFKVIKIDVKVLSVHLIRNALQIFVLVVHAVQTKPVQLMRPHILINAMESDAHLGVNVKETSLVIRHAWMDIAPKTLIVRLQLFHQGQDVLISNAVVTPNANLIYAMMENASMGHRTKNNYLTS